MPSMLPDDVNASRHPTAVNKLHSGVPVTSVIHTQRELKQTGMALHCTAAKCLRCGM